MAAGDTQVSIANRALQLLGASSIESLTQDSPNARTMNRAYDPVRRSLLRRYTWNFSIKRKSIAAVTGETVFEGLNRFPKPNDLLRLLRQTNSIQGNSIRPDWQIEGEYIVSADGSPLEIRYVADISDPALFDSCFSELLSAKIARNTCEEVTGSPVINSQVQDTEAMALTDARQANAFENDADLPLEDDWLLERL